MGMYQNSETDQQQADAATRIAWLENKLCEEP